MPLVRFSRPWWTGDVQNKYGDLALLVCSFVTGLLDCAAFNNWGGTRAHATSPCTRLGLRHD